MKADRQMKIRVPADVKSFLTDEAYRNSSTQNSEVIRSIRERMDRRAFEAKPATERLTPLSEA